MEQNFNGNSFLAAKVARGYQTKISTQPFTLI